MAQGGVKLNEVRGVQVDRQAKAMRGDQPGVFFEFTLHIRHLGIVLTYHAESIACVVYSATLIFDKVAG